MSPFLFPRNTQSAAMAALFVATALSGLGIAGAQERRQPTAGAEILPFGNEQKLVDAMTGVGVAPRKQAYPNELDHVFAVLLARACPTPPMDALIRRTIDALCREAETFAHDRVTGSSRKRWFARVRSTESFEAVLENLESLGKGGLARRRLVDAGLTAMLRATGSKSAAVLSVSQAKQVIEMLGARATPGQDRGALGMDVRGWPIVRIVPDTPAARAGLRDGDVVLRVNGRDIANTERAADGLKALSGTPDATIHITIRRGNKVLTLEIRRATAAERVSMRVLGSGVVSIRIPSFEGSGIADRVRNFIDKTAPIAVASVIIDLRGNPGGRAEEANAVADIFLDEKILQIFEFRNGRRIGFTTKPGAMGVRVFVLTNRDTASAAEMLAIALHDNQRAVVIGRPTAGYLFGKDFEKLQDGRMIVFRSEPTVLSPTGKDYSEIGLAPDILTRESKEGGNEVDDEILARAIQAAHAAAGDTSR